MITHTLNLKSIFVRYIAPAVFCWCLFSLSACKDPAIEDDSLLTDDDNLNLGRDTLYAQVYNLYQEPLGSNGVSTGVLANFSDPNFGKTQAGVYAQIRLSSNNTNFGVNAQLDSVVLTMAYADKYGKFDIPVNVSVYELDQSLVDSTVYYTNSAFSVKPSAIGERIGFTPNTTDSVLLSTGRKMPAHFRVTLNNSFGNRIMADTANLKDNVAFLNYIKGLYITTTNTPVGNGLVYFTLSSSISGVTVYYHNDADDSLSLFIPVSGVRVNHFDQNYTGTPVATSVNNPNPAGEPKAYVQGGAGVRSKIVISDWDSLPKNIAINKAELVLTQTAEDTSYRAPILLDLFRIDDAGNAQVLEDEDQSYYGGTRVTETVNGVAYVRYRFNIKKYFQKLVSGTYNNNGFYLQVLVGNSHSERVVIANPGNDNNYKISFIVTYTKL